MEQWLLISQGEVIVMLVFVCLSDCLWVCVCVYKFMCPQLSITSLNVGQLSDNRLYMLNPGGNIMKIYGWGFVLAH